MSLLSRISRLSYSNRIILNRTSQIKPIANPLLLQTLRRSHGPPTRLGFPHAWGGMVWFPGRVAFWGLLFLQFQMMGLIVWYKWDTIPYPAHRYNDENTTA
eukprot:161698_1